MHAASIRQQFAHIRATWLGCPKEIGLAITLRHDADANWPPTNRKWHHVCSRPIVYSQGNRMPAIRMQGHASGRIISRDSG
ncbi:unnamed protein product [Protopolystoma xenopodis]|uniref:Uncharacterized protein n=1 Tax=Protopolystoma xenopodis TaxID=117903 RepID=A0A448X3I8_9PLAT|nr:unnamed protein product [Protopolystoma xenopodis]